VELEHAFATHGHNRTPDVARNGPKHNNVIFWFEPEIFSVFARCGDGRESSRQNDARCAMHISMLYQIVDAAGSKWFLLKAERDTLEPEVFCDSRTSARGDCMRVCIPCTI
jgi:hypothetical protein